LGVTKLAKSGSEHPLFSFAEPIGLMSGENPAFPGVSGGHEALKHDLQTMGVPFEETQGRYAGVPERSVIIHGLPKEHLISLGKKFGQESVIHNEGGKREFIYTNGPNEGHAHPGLPSVDQWPEGHEAPEDYYTKLPGAGHVRLHFDFDQLHPVQKQPAPPQPAPMHGAGPFYGKHEALHGLYQALKKTLAPTRAAAHPHAYDWHDGHGSHHFPHHGSGGVLISTKLRKDEPKHPHADGALPAHLQGGDESKRAQNDQAAGKGVATYHKFALPFGHIDEAAKAGSGSNLTHYDYNSKNNAVNKLVQDHGYQPYYAGGKFGKPDLANRNYNSKHLMIYDPTDASAGFEDPSYTDSWRKTHELAHALVYPELNQIYGEGRRIGKLGPHRTLREALRAVHWEHLAAHKQRELNRSLGINVPDEVFNKEYNTVMHDAAHRAVTGKFTEPSQEGFTPHSHAVPLETSLGLVREAARNLGLTGMHDLIKKSETTGSNHVADEKKTQQLSIPEALHELHKGLKGTVEEWEQKCLDLRKAELSKPLKKGAVEGGESMAMAEMCKACGEKGCDCSKAESYAKGEMPAGSAPEAPGKKVGVLPDDKKPRDLGGDDHDPKKMKKAATHLAAPAGGGAPSPMPPRPKLPGAAPAGGKVDVKLGASPRPGVMPKVMAKAGMAPGAAPAAPKPPGGAPAAGGAPKLAGAAIPPPHPGMKPMKLPGMGAAAQPKAGGMPKPAAAAAPKTPALGAGSPQMKSEIKKAAPHPGAAPLNGNDFATQRKVGALPPSQVAGVNAASASAGKLMDKVAASQPGGMVGQSLPMTPGTILGHAPVMGASPQPAQGVKTMAERVASKMPASPATVLSPPPAAARAVSLPGAHLFGGAKPAMGKNEFGAEKTVVSKKPAAEPALKPLVPQGQDPKDQASRIKASLASKAKK
jgi:hypothetical protein